jgi:hypothetical protein
MTTATRNTIDRGLIWAIVAFCIIQGSTAIWWASRTNDRLDHVEAEQRTNADDHTKIAVMAAQVELTAKGVQQLTGERLVEAETSQHR